MGRKRTKPPKGTPREILLDRIRQTPGLGLAAFQKACNANGSFEKTYQPSLVELEAEGAVFQHQFPWSDTVFWYEAGYPVDKLFQPENTHRHAVKTYVDSTFKGAWHPGDDLQRRSLDDIPIDANWKPAMQPITPSTGDSQTMLTGDNPPSEMQPQTQREDKTSGDRRRNPNLDRVLDEIETALQQAISNRTYKLPSRNELSLRVELRNYFYTATPAGETAQQAYEEAQERLNDLRNTQNRTTAAQQQLEDTAKEAIAPEEPESNRLLTPTEIAAVQEHLRAELEQERQAKHELEQRNCELRNLIAQLQEQTQQPRFVEVAVPAHWFQQQVKEWQASVDELQADLDAAKANLAAYQRLLSIHEPVTLDVASDRNGHALQLA